MKCGVSGGQPARTAVDKVVRAVAEDGASTLADAGRNFFIGWTGEDLDGVWGSRLGAGETLRK